MTNKDFQITIDHIKANCPTWINYIAADKDNSVWGFSTKPYISNEVWTANNNSKSLAMKLVSLEILSFTQWYKDWKWSLVEIKRESKWIGKFCYFWEDDEHMGTYGVLQSIDENIQYPYICTNSSWTYSCWKHCRPLTKEEIKSFTFEE